MIVMPAVDVRGGACVQLVGGSLGHEAIRLSDPLAAARRWIGAGFTHLHVVDLDGAFTGASSNAATISRIVRGAGAETQVGGGVRDDTALDAVLSLGAARVVVGTRALEDLGWLETRARRRPGRIVVALDVRGDRLALRGWTTDAPISSDEALRWLDGLPLAAVLVTSIDVEGRMLGPNLELMERVADRTTLPLIASGGIGRVEDLRELRARGVWAAVVGMALYTGALDPERTAEEFAQ
jgi:phosphoribosylformimino-5-aminoimidazole carboxamide ribotide isomerase